MRLKADEILTYMPEDLRQAFTEADIDWEKAEEIRLRAGKPVFLYVGSREFYLTRQGDMIAEACRRKEDDLYIAKESEIRQILDKMSGYSLYAYEDELKQGYLTIEGGHRVGLAGKVVVDAENGRIRTMKYLSFLNIRIAHEKKNCGKRAVGKIVDQGQIKHTLIVSPPGCGKTTLLRDLIRLISDGFYYEENGMRKYFEGITVGVVDERSEIGASLCGVPSVDLGKRTDLLDGCPKHLGIFMLLRSMAPKVIAVDEIGGEKDFEAIRQAVNSGCRLLVTAHGNGWKELEKKEAFAAFLKEGIFERCIVLSGKKGKGTVEAVYEMSS